MQGRRRSPRHRRDRLRGDAVVALLGRHHPRHPEAQSAGRLRLADGGRQSRRLPSLASLARDHAAGSGCASPTGRAGGTGRSPVSPRAPMRGSASTASGRRLLPRLAPPAWVLIDIRLSSLSSSEIRRRGPVNVAAGVGCDAPSARHRAAADRLAGRHRRSQLGRAQQSGCPRARPTNCWRSGALTGLPIVHIRHDSLEPASPYRPGQPGNAFLPALAPLAGESVVAKVTNSAFIDGRLVEALDRIGTSDLVVSRRPHPELGRGDGAARRQSRLPDGGCRRRLPGEREARPLPASSGAPTRCTGCHSPT